MVAMRVMQVAIHQIVHVVTVRHSRMSTARSVQVIDRVCGAGVLRRAGLGVGCRNGNQVLIHVVAMGMMEMAIVEIVNVSFMQYRHMPALRAVLMIVALMGSFAAVCHVGAPVDGGRMRGSCGHFHGVLQDITDQIFNMAIGQRVENVLRFAPPRDQPRVV